MILSNRYAITFAVIDTKNAHLPIRLVTEALLRVECRSTRNTKDGYAFIVCATLACHLERKNKITGTAGFSVHGVLNVSLPLT